MPHIDLIVDNETWPSATELIHLMPQDWLWSWYKSAVKKDGYAGWEKCKEASEIGKKLGSEVHELLEQMIAKKALIEYEDMQSTLLAQALFNEVRKTVDEWVAVEPHLKSNKLKLHGTADMIVRLNYETGLWVGDWKTSFRKDIGHPIQLATYALCWNEEHPDQIIDQGFIARVDKKSEKEVPTVKIDLYKGLKDFFPVIQALRTTWDYVNKQGYWRKD